MPTIELRPYQRCFIDELRNQILGGQRRICGVAPCGAGKTIMMGWMIKEAVSRGNLAASYRWRASPRCGIIGQGGDGNDAGRIGSMSAGAAAG